MIGRQPRERNKGYLAALHQIPCIICGGWDVEAAHIRMRSAEWEAKTGVRTGAGGAEKPSDRWSLPLCVKHHRTGPEAEHVIGTVEFWRRHGKDPHLIANELFKAYPSIDRMRVVAMNVLFMGLGKIEEEAA